MKPQLTQTHPVHPAADRHPVRGGYREVVARLYVGTISVAHAGRVLGSRLADALVDAEAERRFWAANGDAIGATNLAVRAAAYVPPAVRYRREGEVL